MGKTYYNMRKQLVRVAEMFGRSSKPAHMFITNVRASESGLSFLRDRYSVIR